MRTLIALAERESFEVPAFLLDHFQRSVREGLHLEFFLAQGRLILTPHLAPLATREASPDEERQVRAILEEKQELLEQLKLYLLYNLWLSSALLETNSYHVAVNQHRVIARFLGHAPGVCEVKLYTQPPGDVLERYADRVYLGRDCLPLDSPRRAHFGLGYLRRSLGEQVAKLRARLAAHGSTAQQAALADDFLAGLEELAEEFGQQADRVLQTYPPDISLSEPAPQTLLAINRDFRELKHLLFEAEAAARETEQRLLAAGSPAARYVTKLRQDLANDVNYIQMKVNGRISDALNGLRA